MFSDLQTRTVLDLRHFEFTVYLSQNSVYSIIIVVNVLLLYMHTSTLNEVLSSILSLLHVAFRYSNHLLNFNISWPNKVTLWDI